MEWYQQVLIALIPAIVVAIVSSILSVRLSLQQFRSERRWEKRFQNLSDLLLAIHDALEANRRDFAHWYREERSLTEVKMPDAPQPYKERWETALLKIRELAALAQLTCSPKAGKQIRKIIDDLDEVEKEAEEYRSWELGIQGKSTVLEKGFDELVILAKDDLGIGPNRWARRIFFWKNISPT